MSEPLTILDAATVCRHNFRAATAVPRLMQQEWAENRLADFNLWSTGAGASASGKASLDHRLHANPEAHAVLVNLLLMLRILIQKCIDGGSENEDTPEELLSRMKDVEDSLHQLVRLTVAIRKAGTRSRLRKADSSYDPGSPQIRSFRRHLELLLLVHPDKHGCSESSKQQLDPAQLTQIQLRLIEANLRRRNRFLYAQKHAQKLGVNYAPRKDLPSEGPVLAQPAARSNIGNTTSLPQVVNVPIEDHLQAQSTTTATRVDDPIVIPPKQVIKSATTVVSTTSSRIAYPKPPLIFDHQIFFTCPCCCQSLPAAVGRGNQWKKHLIGDILPYTCIIEECSQIDTFYMTKETWLSHMDEEHGGVEQWLCHACSQKNINATFVDSINFTTHLEEQHSKGIKPQQIPMLLLAWRRKAPLTFSSCPLCGFESDDQNALLDHTAEHIHSFSLRSLPWGPGTSLGEEVEEEKDSYFSQHPYFDVDSGRSELSWNSSGFLSLATESGSSTGSHSKEANSTHEEQPQLTKESLDQIPHGISGQKGAKNWLEVLSSEPENYNSSSMARESDSLTMFPEFTEPPISKSIPDERRVGSGSGWFRENPFLGALNKSTGKAAVESKISGPNQVASKVDQPTASPISATVTPATIKLLSKDFWMRDENVKDCFLCGEPFSVFRRKHHCRLCGQIYDSKCTTMMQGNVFGKSGTIRVCKTCETIVNGRDDSSEFSDSAASPVDIHD